MSRRLQQTQVLIDAFYADHGPCCAGCDWWRHYNSMIGECICSAPAAGIDRAAMLGIESTTLALGAGHVMTMRDHHCGKFRDVGHQPT